VTILFKFKYLRHCRATIRQSNRARYPQEEIAVLAVSFSHRSILRAIGTGICYGGRPRKIASLQFRLCGPMTAFFLPRFKATTSP
jgi:hypothetical protein